MAQGAARGRDRRLSSGHDLARGTTRLLRCFVVGTSIAAVVLASLATHLFVFLTTSQDCTVGFDTPRTFSRGRGVAPGVAVRTGRVIVGLVIWDGGFLLSLVATVGLVVFAWRRWSWPVGVPSLALAILLPVATSLVLNLPADYCTAEARAAHTTDGGCAR